jgi:hypothetical protein
MSRLLKSKKGEMLVNITNNKFFYSRKVQHMPLQSHITKRPIQQSLHYNQFGRPFKQLQNPKLRIRQFHRSFPNYPLVKKPFSNNRVNSQIRQWQLNRQLKRRGKPSLTSLRLKQTVRPSLTNQQRRQTVRKSLINPQQRQTVRSSQATLRQRQTIRPSFINQQKRKQNNPSRPNPRIKKRFKQEEKINRLRVFTPQGLLKLAPMNDKAIWELIISRLPNDYSIPDRQIIPIFEAFSKRK